MENIRKQGGVFEIHYLPKTTYLNVHKFSDTLNLAILYNDEISAYKI